MTECRRRGKAEQVKGGVAGSGGYLMYALRDDLQDACRIGERFNRSKTGEWVMVLLLPVEFWPAECNTSCLPA